MTDHLTDTNVGNIEYIRKQDAVKASLEFTVEYLGGAFDEGLQKGLKNKLESLEPADVVQVVRCDDCVYYGSRRWCELHSSVFDDNAFCSYGEKREE